MILSHNLYPSLNRLCIPLNCNHVTTVWERNYNFMQHRLPLLIFPRKDLRHFLCTLSDALLNVFTFFSAFSHFFLLYSYSSQKTLKSFLPGKEFSLLFLRKLPNFFPMHPLWLLNCDISPVCIKSFLPISSH